MVISVEATGVGTLSYQWYSVSEGMLEDGGSISGATTPFLSLSDVQLGDSDEFYCEITDNAATEDGSGESNEVAESFDIPMDVFEDPGTGLFSFEPFVSYPEGVSLSDLDPGVAGYDGSWFDAAFGDAVPRTYAGSLTYGDPAYHAGIGGKVGKDADAETNTAANSGRVERLLDPCPQTTSSHKISRFGTECALA